MNTQHTPGPWPIEKTGDGKRYIVGEECSSWGTHVAEVHSDDIDKDEALANARLIAAAPELLEACMALLECWNPIDVLPDHLAKYRDARDKGRSAIAKATGA